MFLAELNYLHSPADRLSGLFFLLLGLAMVFLVIPANIETTEDANLGPGTMPTLVSVIMAACGALLIIRPSTHQLHDRGQFLRAGAFIIVLLLSVLAMSRFGFVYVSPFLALVVMLLIGERRPGWLIVGTVIVPVIIWFAVTQLLDRSLP